MRFFPRTVLQLCGSLVMRFFRRTVIQLCGTFFSPSSYGSSVVRFFSHAVPTRCGSLISHTIVLRYGSFAVRFLHDVGLSCAFVLSINAVL